MGHTEQARTGAPEYNIHLLYKYCNIVIESVFIHFNGKRNL